MCGFQTHDMSGVDIYSRFTPGPVVLGACGTLL